MPRSKIPTVVISSGSESDSDVEGLVEMVFSKAQANVSRKSKFGSNTALNLNRDSATTTTTSTTTTPTTRPRRCSKRIQQQSAPETPQIFDNKSLGDSGELSFFIDTKPAKNKRGTALDSGLALESETVTNDPIPAASTSGVVSFCKNNDDIHDGAGVTSSQVKKTLDKSCKDDDSSSEEVESRPSQSHGKEKGRKKKVERKKSKSDIELSSSLQTGLDSSDVYVNVHSFHQPQEHTPQIDALLLGGKDHKIMKKSVITPDFEKRDRALPYIESMRKLKMQRRKERAKTKGNGWFNMPATELTEQRKNDLKVLQMRHALDPKRFYRANDFTTAPKYFQFGTVVESKADFYSSRIPKKQRKATLVDELFADAEFRRFNKRKYAEIEEAKRTGTGPYQKMRFPKKRKKTKK